MSVLSGIRVIEVASWTFVPSAGAVLAEWGADVVKVEDPARPDPQRGLVSSLRLPQGGVNFMVEIANRGKRAVTLDLSSDAGRALLLRLIDGADVFLTNHLPDVRRRLGIDAPELQARNPRLVYARGSAHGPRGAEADRGGFDVATYWARGGIAAAGIVDVSLLGLALWQLSPDIAAARLYEDVELPTFDRDSLPNPLTGTYETRDGRFITLMMIESQRHWPALCAHLDRPDLADHPDYRDAAARFEHRVACIRLLRAIFAERSFAEWCDRLVDFAGVWAPVRTPREVHDDPQVAANDYLTPIPTNAGPLLDVPANPVQFDLAAPRVGGAPEHAQHTEEILLELGIGFDEILDFKAAGAI